MGKQQLIIKINYYIGIILFYLRFYKKANESFSKVLRINDKNAAASFINNISLSIIN